jgi:hypothetical protein
MRVRHFFVPTERLHRQWEQAVSQVSIGMSPLLLLKAEGEWYAIFNAQQLSVTPYIQTELANEPVTVCLLDEFFAHFDWALQASKQKAA